MMKNGHFRHDQFVDQRLSYREFFMWLVKLTHHKIYCESTCKKFAFLPNGDQYILKPTKHVDYLQLANWHNSVNFFKKIYASFRI